MTRLRQTEPAGCVVCKDATQPAGSVGVSSQAQRSEHKLLWMNQPGNGGSNLIALAMAVALIGASIWFEREHTKERGPT